MKNLLFTLLAISISYAAFAQLRADDPWVDEYQSKTGKKLQTLDEISAAFDAYWETRDETRKGCGYKPFKRWENHWSSFTRKDGTLMTSAEIWSAWEQKRRMESQGNKVMAPVSSDWQPLGPYSVSYNGGPGIGQGRVNVVVIDPNNPNTYYVGAPAGGIWKSTDAGINWTPLSDYLPEIGVSGIAIDPNNSNIIYIATGDDDHSDSFSVGVLKSTDGGTTWNATGLNLLGTYNQSNDIFISPLNSSILWVATTDGVYKTTDAGATWNKKLTGRIKDLKMRPGDPSIFYAATKTAFYKSTNGGESFFQITNGLPSSSERLVIAVTPANANFVYVLSSAPFGDPDGKHSFNGVYKSTNNGVSFTQTGETDLLFGPNQAWYDLTMAVSDTDPNIVVLGEVWLFRSFDGGNNFTYLGSSGTHADQHFLNYVDGQLLLGNDGGVYRSTDNATSFTDLTETLSISQFYKIEVAQQNSGNIAGGLQDNGGFGLSNQSWKKYHGADGMDCVIDLANPNVYYGLTQYGGSLYRSTNAGSSGNYVASRPSGESGEWVVPMETNSQGEIFVGYTGLYKLNQSTNNFVAVSGTFGKKIYTFKIAPTDDDIVYLATNNPYELLKSTNGGQTFTALPYTFSGRVNAIEVSKNNPNLLWIATYNKVHKSMDGGNTFTDVTSNLPPEPKLSLISHLVDGSSTLYLGSGLGVYYMEENATQWEAFSTNLPNVAVKDLAINTTENKLFAATFGRGVFVTSIEEAGGGDCGGGTEVADCNVTIGIDGLDVSLVSTTPNGSQIIKIRTATWDFQADLCNDYSSNPAACTSGASIAVPSAGTYVVDIQGTTNCTFTIEVTGASGGGGVDADNDGICSDDDCDDNDASIGAEQAPGTACDDGDPDTINDVILGNGCDCEGVPTQCNTINESCNGASVEVCGDVIQVTITDFSIYQITINDAGNGWSVVETVCADWAPGNQCNPGSFSYTVPSSSQYAVSFTYDGGGNCGSGVFPVTAARPGNTPKGNGMSSFLAYDKILVEPNPVKNTLRITTVGDLSIREISLYTVTGKKILTRTDDLSSLNLQDLPQGIYFLSFQTDNGYVTKKIIKQ